MERFQMEQVFRNVFENSLAARRDPVQIEIDCSVVSGSGHSSVRIMVRDNGAGLTTERKRRIFEPFFTTKAKGRGLGMAIAQRVVETHGGTISVVEEAPGAAILIVLPQA